MSRKRRKCLMAMMMFAGKGQGSKVPVSTTTAKHPWVKVYRNGQSSSMILIFNAAATALFALYPSDRGDLYFDPRRKAIGFRKSREGSVTLTQHGSNDTI